MISTLVHVRPLACQIMSTPAKATRTKKAQTKQHQNSDTPTKNPSRKGPPLRPSSPEFAGAPEAQPFGTQALGFTNASSFQCEGVLIEMFGLGEAPKISAENKPKPRLVGRQLGSGEETPIDTLQAPSSRAGNRSAAL